MLEWGPTPTRTRQKKNTSNVQRCHIMIASVIIDRAPTPQNVVDLYIYCAKKIV